MEKYIADYRVRMGHVKDKHNGKSDSLLNQAVSEPGRLEVLFFFSALDFPAAILCLDLTHRWSCDLSTVSLLWE